MVARWASAVWEGLEDPCLCLVGVLPPLALNNLSDPCPPI